MVRRRINGIHAAQRLVEDQHLGIVRERLRHLDSLAHAFAVGTDFLVRRVEQIDRFQCASRSRFCLSSSRPFNATSAVTHPRPVIPLVERVLLGTETDAVVERRVSQIGSPRTVIAPLLGLSCPVTSFMNVDLPAPLGPSRPVIPGGTLTLTS
jgi:hypothetical protein